MLITSRTSRKQNIVYRRSLAGFRLSYIPDLGFSPLWQKNTIILGLYYTTEQVVMHIKEFSIFRTRTEDWTEILR